MENIIAMNKSEVYDLIEAIHCFTIINKKGSRPELKSLRKEVEQMHDVSHGWSLKYALRHNTKFRELSISNVFNIWNKLTFINSRLLTSMKQGVTV